MLPAAEFAVTVHDTAFDTLDQTDGALGTVVAERAIGGDVPIRKHYLIGALVTPDEMRHCSEVC